MWSEFNYNNIIIINFQYNAVLRDCVEYSLLPLQELPKRYASDRIIKKVERIFGVSATDLKTKLVNSGLDYRVSITLILLTLSINIDIDCKGAL